MLGNEDVKSQDTFADNSSLVAWVRAIRLLLGALKLSQPDLYGYEKWTMFPLLGFIIYRMPFLILGLLVVLYAELIWLDMRHKKIYK
jgi:hypothetical protein